MAMSQVVKGLLQGTCAVLLVGSTLGAHAGNPAQSSRTPATNTRPPVTTPPPPTVVVTPANRNGNGQVSPS